LRSCPRTVKQEEHAMMEKIDEVSERSIAGVTESIARVFGDVDGQRPARSEHPEEGYGETPGTALPRTTEGSDGRGREGGGWVLSHTYRLIARSHGFAEPRLVTKSTLETAHGCVKIELFGALLERRERAHSVGRCPRIAGHRMISPRCV